MNTVKSYPDNDGTPGTDTTIRYSSVEIIRVRLLKLRSSAMLTSWTAPPLSL